MAKWYRAISNDLSRIPDFIQFYEDELEQAKREISMMGKTIEKNQAELPGIVENRFSQLQEIEAVLELLNIKLKQTRSNVFRTYLEKYAKSLTSRDAEKYTDGDIDVVDMAILVNEVALLRNRFLSLHKGLEQKSWMLGHITKLKCAGLDDARLE